MRDVVIVEAVRAPIGKRNGTLSTLLPVHLAARVLKALIERAQIDPVLIEDVIFGCVTPLGEQGANIARLAVLQAGFPVEVPAVSLNRMCGSSQQAVHFAAQEILSGDMEVVIAGGIDMSWACAVHAHARRPPGGAHPLGVRDQRGLPREPCGRAARARGGARARGRARRRRDRTFPVHRSGACTYCDGKAGKIGGTTVGLPGSAVRHRQPGDVLGHPAHRGFLN